MATPTYNLDPAKQTVTGQLDGLLQKDSPLMQKAATQGEQYANTRGLLNSSIGAGATQSAMMDFAMPIAEADAGIYNMYGKMQYDADLAKDIATNAGNIEKERMGLQNQYEQSNMRLEDTLAQGQMKLDDTITRGQMQLDQNYTTQNMTLEQQLREKSAEADYYRSLGQMDKAAEIERDMATLQQQYNQENMLLDQQIQESLNQQQQNFTKENMQLENQYTQSNMELQASIDQNRANYENALSQGDMQLASQLEQEMATLQQTFQQANMELANSLEQQMASYQNALDQGDMQLASQLEQEMAAIQQQYALDTLAYQQQFATEQMNLSATITERQMALENAYAQGDMQLASQLEKEMAELQQQYTATNMATEQTYTLSQMEAANQITQTQMELENAYAQGNMELANSLETELMTLQQSFAEINMATEQANREATMALEFQYSADTMALADGYQQTIMELENAYNQGDMELAAQLEVELQTKLNEFATALQNDQQTFLSSEAALDRTQQTDITELNAELAIEAMIKQQQLAELSAQADYARQQGNMTLAADLENQRDSLLNQYQTELAELQADINIESLALSTSANLQGAYIAAVDEITNNAMVSINEIEVAEGITQADKDAMIQNTIDRRDADLAFTRMLYSSMPTWDYSWVDIPDYQMPDAPGVVAPAQTFDEWKVDNPDGTQEQYDQWVADNRLTDGSIPPSTDGTENPWVTDMGMIEQDWPLQLLNEAQIESYTEFLGVAPDATVSDYNNYLYFWNQQNAPEKLLINQPLLSESDYLAQYPDQTLQDYYNYMDAWYLNQYGDGTTSSPSTYPDGSGYDPNQTYYSPY